MRRALARLLGVVLTLALTSVVAMAALSSLSAQGRVDSPQAELPLYFNVAPRNVHDLAQGAVRRLALGHDAAAERELARLGGAALPHVLPGLAELPSEARGRVARALTPVARRMGVAGDEDLNSPENAIAFWERFWQDRAFDFRPQVVRRMVGRLAQRSNALRVEDILHLDTYSLSELIPALGAIRSVEDVRRAERLTHVLSHVTGRGPLVTLGMSQAEARSAVLAWQSFWLKEGSDFVTLDGPRRVVATFAQTHYGTWVLHALGVLRNPAAQAAGALGIPLRLALFSALRLLVALAGAVVLGAAWVRLERTRAPRWGVATRLLATLLVTLPAPFVAASLGAPEGNLARNAFAVLLTGTLGASLLSRHALPIVNTPGSPSTPRLTQLLATVAGACPSGLPWLMTAALSLELVLELDGAAPIVLDRLAKGDVIPGMSLALGGSSLAVFLVSLAHRAAPKAVPLNLRAPALIEVGGASRRRRWWLGLTTLLLLALFGAGWSRGNAELGGWSALSEGARALLGYGSLTVLVATVAGLAFGAAAASGPTAFDGALTRTLEVFGGLPTVLWAAALARWFGPGLALALCLGLLRAIDVAWLLRSELFRRASQDQDLGARSLGHLPLSIYLQRRLRPAALPALSAAAMTPAWLLAVAVAGRTASLPASAGAAGWSYLFVRPLADNTLPCLVAVLLLSLLTWLLLGTITAAPRRVGAARGSVPPADGAIDASS
ncbi:MAG TPA: ABC transporter permease subunit [Polyangiaceae bacterium]|nr:ABC transporter permease subunit [Polyangiaceae bacterium]